MTATDNAGNVRPDRSYTVLTATNTNGGVRHVPATLA